MSFFIRYITNKSIYKPRLKPIKKRKSFDSATEIEADGDGDGDGGGGGDGGGEDEPQKQLERKEPDYQTHMLDLPSHIIIDILSRLPVKSILICRCVCKTWRYFISDPLLSNYRLNRGDVEVFLRTDSTICISRTHYLVDFEESIFNYVSPPAHHALLKPVKREATINMRFSLPKRESKPRICGLTKCEYSIVNSCNGFICLRKNSSKSPCIVCNPITGEFITIPKPEKYENIRSIIVAGFGCSLRSNEYKLVRLIFRNLALNPADRTAEVYTLGTASWRNIGSVPNDLVLGLHATYFNGAIHWICDDDGPDFILAFDCEKEKFHTVPPPPHFSEKEKDFTMLYQMSMGVLGGCLFICESTLPPHLDIWVMKDYGVQASWTKAFSIDLTSWGRCKPIKCLDNGELVMIRESCSLVLYNPVKKCFRVFSIRAPHSVLFEAIVHFPNFGSFKDIAGGDNLKVESVHSRWTESELWEDETLSLVEGRSNVGMLEALNLW